MSKTPLARAVALATLGASLTLPTVLEMRALTAPLSSEYSSGPSLRKALGSRPVPARSSDESSFRPRPA